MSARRVFWCWLALALLLLAVTAHAEQWSRAVLADDVAVSVTQVSELELAALRAKHKQTADADCKCIGRAAPVAAGFSLLFRAKSGAYRCEVYVRDPNDAETLEHELKHCHGWVHQ